MRSIPAAAGVSCALVGRRIRVRFTRIPRATVPAGAEQRVRWLDDVWAETDEWVCARLAALERADPAPGPPA